MQSSDRNQLNHLGPISLGIVTPTHSLGEAIDHIPKYFFDLIMLAVCARMEPERMVYFAIEALEKGATDEEVRVACARGGAEPCFVLQEALANIAEQA